MADPGTGSLIVVEEHGMARVQNVAGIGRPARTHLPTGQGWPRLAEAGGRPEPALALAGRA